MKARLARLPALLLGSFGFILFATGGLSACSGQKEALSPPAVARPHSDEAQSSAEADNTNISADDPALDKELSAATIREVVQGSFDKLRACYEAGLLHDSKLSGRVTVQFVVHESGRVKSADLVEAGGAQATTLEDEQVLDCMLKTYLELEFPRFSSGQVSVVYPIMFSPEKTSESDTP